MIIEQYTTINTVCGEALPEKPKLVFLSFVFCLFLHDACYLQLARNKEEALSDSELRGPPEDAPRRTHSSPGTSGNYVPASRVSRQVVSVARRASCLVVLGASHRRLLSSNAS